MLDFVTMARNNMFTPEKEKIHFSKSEPYLFCTDWRNQIKVRALGLESLDDYLKLGGNTSAMKTTSDGGSGVITRCNKKVDLGWYNLSTREMKLKNTVLGVHVVIPYFDGATEADIKRLLMVYPIAVYYNTARATKLVYCSAKNLNQVVYEMIAEKGWISSSSPKFTALYKPFPKFVVDTSAESRKRYITETQVTVFDMFSSRNSQVVDLLQYHWYF